MDKKEVLQDVKTNVINWYDFKENSNLLMIGNDLEAIQEMLQSKMAKIVYVQNDIENIAFGEKFDYIILKDDIKKLELAKQYLTLDGTILLWLNNRFGISNFAGQDRFASIYGENPNLHTKKEIENILKEQGFSDYQFFYPLPNYEITNVLFSDDYLPEYNHTKLLNQSIYREDVILVLDELKALKQVTKFGEFPFFANSFLVEINPKTEIKFVSFNNTRKKEYRLCTKIYKDYAVKEATNQEAKRHIINLKNNIENLKEYGFEIIDKAENGRIISPYMAGKNFYQIILEMLENGKIDEALEKIEKWFDEIKIKLGKDKTDKINEDMLENPQNLENLTIVKRAYLDLVFENTFCRDKEFVFFDQEWVVPNLPLEFILYRAIHNIYVYHSEIEKIFPQEEILKRFGLLEYCELFEALEGNIQNFIMDKSILEIYQTSNHMIQDIKKLEEMEQENLELITKTNLFAVEEKKKAKYIDQLTKEKGDLEARVKLLEIEENKKKEYIEQITKEKGDLEARKRLLEVENTKKEVYIEQITKEKGDLEVENIKKEVYIQQMRLEREEEVAQFKKVDAEKDRIIQQLNEIIKHRENQIEVYESMKAVQLTKKLREKRKGKSS